MSRGMENLSSILIVVLGHGVELYCYFLVMLSMMLPMMRMQESSGISEGDGTGDRVL